MITKTKTFLNEPYELYFKLLENKNNKSKLLEIGAGIYPILKIILNEELISNFSNWIDTTFKIKKSAFKFVIKMVKKNKI